MLLTFVTGWSGAMRTEADPLIRIGEPFPELVLPGMEDGDPRSITGYRGKKIILHMFASW